MPQRSELFVAGLVLAAGGSSRLGVPKQLLPYRGDTLLGQVVGTARGCMFDQLVVALGASADEIRDAVPFDGITVVENRVYGEGCSSSIAAALPAIDSSADLLVLMLGDQPGVTPETVRALIDGWDGAPLAACLYDDGRGHPLAFARSTFGELSGLHGDKAVWKLMDRLGSDVREVRVPGAVPPDVDTWDDYEALLAEEAPAA